MAGTSTFLIEYTRLQKLSGDASAGTLVYHKQAIVDAYSELCEANDWPWLHYTGLFNTVAAYTTGTVTIVDDTTDYATTTGSWTTTWSPMRLRTAAGHDYLLTYNSGNSRWELDRNAASFESGVTYTLYKDTYALAARLRSCYYAHPEKSPDGNVSIVSNPEMGVLKTGTTMLIRDPITHMAFVDPDTTNYVSQVEVWPIPSTVYTVRYKGYRQVTAPSDDAHTFIFPQPLLPVFRALAEAHMWSWRGRADLEQAARAKYDTGLARAVNRAAPDADAGASVRLDERYFGGRWNDPRPRLGGHY